MTTNDIKNRTIAHIQAQLNQLAAVLPGLKEEEEPAGQLWSDVLQELKNLSRNVNRQELLLEIIAAISNTTSSITEIDDLLEALVNLIRDHFDFAYVGIFLVDETNEWAELRAMAGETSSPQLQKNYRLKIDNKSTVGRTIQQQQASITLEVESESHPCSEMILPLTNQEHTVGALILQSTANAAFRLGEEDIPLMQPLADQLGNTIQNTKLLATANQQLEQVIALHHINLQAGSQLDLDTLLADVAQLSVKLTGADASIIRLADKNQETFTIRATHNLPADTGQPEQSELGLSNYVANTRQAILANNWPNHPFIELSGGNKKVEENSKRQIDKDILALLNMPIILQDKVIGTLEVQSFTKIKAFDEHDLYILSLLVSQAAAAIENIRLFNQAENNHRFLKTVIEHIPDPIFIKDKNYTLIEMNQANANVIGKPEEELIGKTNYDFLPQELADKFRRRDDEVFAANQIFVAEDKTVWGDGKEHIAYTRLVPIPDSSGQPEYLLGITHDVTERKAYEAERERILAETEALYKGSRAIASTLAERQLFEALFEQIRYQDPCEICAFRFNLVDDEPIGAELKATWHKRDNPSYPIGTRFDLSETLQARLLTTNEPLFIDDIATDDRLLATERESFVPTGACSVAILPLVVAGQKLGVVLVYFTRPYTFTEATQRLWLALADQAGVGLANHQLIQEAAYHVTQMKTAAEVARAASSILDLQELLNSAVALIRDRFDLYYVGIFLADKTKEWAVLRAGTGEAGRIQLKKGHRLKIGSESMIGWSIHNRQPRIALDVGKDAVHFQNPDLPDTRSEIALPLIHRSKVIGALTIQSVEQAAFSQEDIIFLETMADQLAIAIENARLFEQAQQEIAERKLAEQEISQRNEELAAINRVATAVVSVLDLPGTLKAVSRELVQIFDAYRSGITLLNPERTELSIVAVHSTDADEHGLLEGMTIPLADNPSSTQVVETGKSIVVPEAQTNPLTQPIHNLLRKHGTQCMMIVPLLVRQEVIGTIGVDLVQTDREFTLAEIRLAETIAGQIASAVENARLFEETQAALRERKRAEEALRASEAKYRELVQSANSIIIRLNTKGQVTFFNEFAQSFFGYTEEEILGQNAVGTFVPEIDTAGRDLVIMIEDIIQHPEQYTNNENENIRRNGERVWVTWTNKAIRDKEGQITEILCVGNDVTQRKQVEETLAKREQYLAVLVEVQNQLLAFDRVENYYPKILELLGQVSGASRTYIFENHRDAAGNLLMSQRAEWCAEDIRPQIDNPALQNLPYDEFSPRWAETLARGEIIAGKVAEFPQSERVILEPQDILAILILPLIVNGEFFGFIGFDNCLEARAWEPSEVDLLRAAAAAISLWHERRQAEETLAEEQYLLHTLMENTPDHIYFKNTGSRFVRVNKAQANWFGLSDPAQAVGKTDFDFFSDEHAQQAYTDEQEIMRTGQPIVGIEEKETWPDGHETWVSTTKMPLRDQQGNIVGVFGISRDITERKEAEEALRLTQFSVDRAPDAIFWVGPDARFLYVNEGACQSLGYSQEELLSMTVHDIDPHFTPEIWPDHWQDIKQNPSKVIESQHRTKDGRILPVEIRINYFEFNGKEYNFAFTRDITERKQSEEAAQEALRRTQLFYNISEALSMLTDQQAALETVLGEYLLLLKLDRGGIMLLDPTSEYNRVQALYIDNKVVIEPDLAFPVREDLVAQHLIGNPFPLVIEDTYTHPLTKHNQEMRGNVHSMLLIPLITRDEVVGILGADATEKGYVFTHEDIAMGEAIADQLTVWLENRQLLEETQHRSNLLQTAAEVSRAASSILDVDQLINTSVNFIRDQFDFYYVGLFLVGEPRQWAVLRAGTGEAGRIQLEKGHRLKIGGESMIGWCVQHSQARIALDVGEEAVHFQNPYLPDTHSEMALPLISRDEVIGALTVQSVERGAFSDEDITLLQAMADQLANAIANARLFEHVAHSQKTAEALLQETQALQHLSQALAGTLRVNEILNFFFQACTQEVGFDYIIFSLVDTYQHRVKAIGGFGVTENNIKQANHSLDSNDIMADIIRTGQTEVVTGWDDRFNKELYEAEGHANWVRVFTPVTLRQEHIGLVEAGFKDPRARIKDSHLRLLRAFIDQTALALDNAQRYEVSQRSARYEALIKEITTKVRASTDLDTILQTTVKEVGNAMGGKRTYVHLISPTNGEAKDSQ